MTTRQIEINIPKKTLEDLLASHLYSVSYVNDNEDIEIDFHARYLKSTSDTIPITIKLKSKEVKHNNNDGS